MQPFLGRDWQMRHGSRHDSGSRHSADTLRSSSGGAAGGSGGPSEGSSSWESERQEEVGCDSEQEGCDEERRSSWEAGSGAEESPPQAGGAESERHWDGGEVTRRLPSGTSTPSCSSPSEPVAGGAARRQVRGGAGGGRGRNKDKKEVDEDV